MSAIHVGEASALNMGLCLLDDGFGHLDARPS